MVNLIITFALTAIAATIPWTAFSAEIDMVHAKHLVKRYTTIYERPKSCPMESKFFSDLLVKTEAIKDALNGNCAKSDDGKMTEVLASIKSLQQNLKDNAATSNGEVISGLLGDSSKKNAVSGQQVSRVLSNINLMIKKSQCNMEDGSIIQGAADLIYSSTQLGILAGNKTGLVVAGTGFIASSALRLIDLIIKQKFNFEKPLDRQIFIKLNCSFFEIRRELDTLGALNIENSTTRDDFRDTKVLLEAISIELKKSESEKYNIDKANAEIDRMVMRENIGDLTDLKNSLLKIQKYLQPGINQTLEIPTETQKLLMISQLAQDYNLLSSQIKIYKELNISIIPLLDDLFILEMKKFDPLDALIFTESLNISAREFNDNYRAKILFHIIRIGSDIEIKEKTFFGKGDKQKSELLNSIEKRISEYLSVFNELKKIEVRLGNIISPKQYSGIDDGSDNIVGILDNYNKISFQIYGVWGDNFLKFATEKSLDKVEAFNERFISFNKKYKEIMNYVEFDKIKTSYFCQDTQKLRIMFKHADGIVQEGFDFVSTNKDLIYSDVTSSYNGSLNEEESRVVSGPVVKIQRHYKSALYALKILNGEDVSSIDFKKYLEKSAFKSYFLGRAMLEVSKAKVNAMKVQDIYEHFDCQKRLTAEL